MSFNGHLVVINCHSIVKTTNDPPLQKLRRAGREANDNE